MKKTTTFGILLLLLATTVSATTDSDVLCNRPQDMRICMGAEPFTLEPLGWDYCSRYDFNNDDVVNLVDVQRLAVLCAEEPEEPELTTIVNNYRGGGLSKSEMKQIFKEEILPELDKRYYTQEQVDIKIASMTSLLVNGFDSAKDVIDCGASKIAYKLFEKEIEVGGCSYKEAQYGSFFIKK